MKMEVPRGKVPKATFFSAIITNTIIMVIFNFNVCSGCVRSLWREEDISVVDQIMRRRLGFFVGTGSLGARVAATGFRMR
jgi:hypothetical protein